MPTVTGAPASNRRLAERTAVQRLLVLAVALAVAPGAAQTPAPFDVVSIKPNHTGAEASDTNTSPGRLSLVNVTPLSLIRRAFAVQDSQIAGHPDWASTERFDVVALTGDDRVLNDRDRQPLLQQMLAHRWQLRYHRETRDRGIYSLEVIGASKLGRHDGPGEYAMKVEPIGGRIVVRSTRGNLGRLVEILSRYTDRLVFDDTSLTGEFDFTLEWMQDPGADVAGPTLFTALREQLGLRLVSTRRAIPVIVVDHLERPSAN